jgi:hypothetical protein
MIKFHEINDTVIAELNDDNLIISQTQDILDLFGDLVYKNCNRMIIHKRNLHEDFFKLQTGIAGDILQKFSNYRIKLAIIGNFSEYKSKSLQDFIRECNKGNSVFFLNSYEDALNRMTRK